MRDLARTLFPPFIIMLMNLLQGEKKQVELSKAVSQNPYCRSSLGWTQGNKSVPSNLITGSSNTELVFADGAALMG